MLMLVRLVPLSTQGARGRGSLVPRGRADRKERRLYVQVRRLVVWRFEAWPNDEWA